MKVLYIPINALLETVVPYIKPSLRTPLRLSFMIRVSYDETSLLFEQKTRRR